MTSESLRESTEREVELGRPVVRRPRGALLCRVAGTALVLPVYVLLLWFVVAHLMGDPRGSWRPGALVLAPATFIVSLVVVRPLWGGVLSIVTGGYCLWFFHDPAARVLSGGAPILAGALLTISSWLNRRELRRGVA